MVRTDRDGRANVCPPRPLGVRVPRRDRRRPIPVGRPAVAAAAAAQLVASPPPAKSHQNRRPNAPRNARRATARRERLQEGKATNFPRSRECLIQRRGGYKSRVVALAGSGRGRAGPPELQGVDPEVAGLRRTKGQGQHPGRQHEHAQRHQFVFRGRVMVEGLGNLAGRVRSGYFNPCEYSPSFTFALVSTEISKISGSSATAARAAFTLSKIASVWAVFFSGFAF